MAQMSDDAKRAALGNVDFFKGCTARELDDITHMSEERNYAPGEELCHESAFERLVFVIIDGEATVTLRSEEIGVAGAGDVVGELAMLGDGRRSALGGTRDPSWGGCDGRVPIRRAGLGTVAEPEEQADSRSASACPHRASLSRTHADALTSAHASPAGFEPARTV